MIKSLEQQLAPLAPPGFLIELTKDGSPTLRLPNHGESMHHSGGAAAETRYIYAEVLDRAHQSLGLECKTCIVGLGLGYIEISWAISLLKNSLTPSNDLSFHSFEVVPELTAGFLNWLESDTEDGRDLIVQKMSVEFSSSEVKRVLKKALACGSSIENDLMRYHDKNTRWNIICYDAFSQKTSSALWQTDFLSGFLKAATGENCVFTTYACTGVLRKSLIECGFTFVKRPGFFGKRDSTLAFRGTLKHASGPFLGQTF